MNERTMTRNIRLENLWEIMQRHVNIKSVGSTLEAPLHVLSAFSRLVHPQKYEK